MVSVKRVNDGYIVVDDKTGKLLSRHSYRCFKVSKYGYAGIRQNSSSKVYDIFNKEHGCVLTISAPVGYCLNLSKIDFCNQLAVCVELENKEFVCPNKKLFYTSYGEELNEYLTACKLNPDALRVIDCSTNNNEIEFADNKKCYVFSLDDYCIVGTRELDTEKEI